ncbi:putative efflux protein, MATE family [Thermobacillus composti KWC4]|jgi:putative MATE family efflux protein|uniref:Putative efflux protein, MATE family n=1 Tax=Thermobacillus composti (strain DSM 18247 / JCM 13945 / KWC4) TaxID=717605 RepID=L0EHT3_THECK|nr:MATE family efflux transporter [Thermobacillus composti]AGA59337.1 putative efflux protein, MATE family [Thermobacillus composti KWC4]
MSTARKYTLWALAWPIFLELFLQFMLGAADTLMVSRISDDAVAVVGYSNQLFNGIYTIFQAIAGGAGILIAQKLGAKREGDARTISVLALYMVSAVAVIFSLLLAFKPLWFARLLRFPGELFPLAEVYIAIVGGGTLLVAVMFALGTVIRNTGNTKGPMIVSVGINVLHVALNYAFITGSFGFPEWGLTGVAISTNVSRAIGVAVLFWMFLSAFETRIRLRDFRRYDRKLLAAVLKISWPLGVNGGSWCYSQIVIFAFIAILGSRELAARTYMNTLESFCFMLGWAFAMAVQIQIAHLYGAGKYREAYRSGYRATLIGLAVVTVNAVLLVPLGKPVLGLFTDNADIVRMGVSLLLLNIVLQPGKMINMAMVSSLNAVGDTRFPMVVNVIVQWSVAVGLSCYLGLHLGWGLTGIYIGMIMDEYVRGVTVTLRWWRQKYLRRAGGTAASAGAAPLAAADG